MKLVKEGTLKYKAINVLGNLGGAWRKDYLFCLKYIVKGNDSQAYRLYRDLLRNELIIERTVNKLKGKRNRNDSSIEVILNLENLNFDARVLTNYRAINKPYLSNSDKKLYRLLSDSKIEILLYCSGIKVFKGQKPSLSSVSNFTDYIKINDAESEDEYLQLSNDYWQSNLLEDHKGFYYSSKEVREFISLYIKENDKYSINPTDVDAMIQSRIRGVILNNETLYFVYISSPGQNGLIRIHLDGENKFIDYANTYLSSLIGKNVMNFNKIDAIIISDGDSMVYTTTIGNPAGRIKEVDLLEKEQAKIENYKRYHKGRTPKYSWITSKTEIFNNIFIVPFNKTGVSMFSNIYCKNKLILKNKVLNVLRNCKQDLTTNSLLSEEVNCFGRFRDYDLLYLPEYNAKLFAKINRELNRYFESTLPAQREPIYILVNNRDMADPISHSIRWPIIFLIGGKDGKLFKVSTNKYKLYDDNGIPRGMNDVIVYGKINNCKIGNKELNSLPKAAGYDNPNKFWNDVSEGKVEFAPLIDLNNLKQNSSERARKPRKKRKTLYVKEKSITELSKKAQEQGITVNRYITNLIYKDLKNVE